MRFGRTVEGDHALVDEVFVVGKIAKAAAIGEDGVLRIAPVPQALILEFPDGAAQQRRLRIDLVVVLAKGAHRVEHGVGKFVHVERLGERRIHRDLFQVVQPRVGLAVKIRGIVLADAIFAAEIAVMDRPGWIERLDGGDGTDQGCAFAGFVAKRPDDDRRMVLEVFDIGKIAIEDRLGEVLLAGQQRIALLAIPEPMRLDIRLGNHPEAILVAELVPARIVGIMRGADMVAVALLDHLDVADHLRLGDGMADIGVVLMAVDSLELDRNAVDHEDASLDLDLAEADAGGEEFRLLPFF